MVVRTLVVFLLPMLVLGPPARTEKPGPELAAESIVLKDGKTVAGLLLEPQPRGKTVILASAITSGRSSRNSFRVGSRRSKPSQNRPGRTGSPGSRLGSKSVPETLTRGCKLSTWINREIKKIQSDKAVSDAPLMIVPLDRKDVTKTLKRNASHTRLIRLAWLANIDDPESMKADDLSRALEAKGVSLKGDDQGSIEKLMPMTFETREQWSVRGPRLS